MSIDTMTARVQQWILAGMDADYATDVGAALLAHYNRLGE